MTRRLHRNTPEEEAAIQVGIAQDPDNPELTDEDWARMRPAREVMPRYIPDFEERFIRGAAQARAEGATLPLDQDVAERMQASGPNWQARANEVLRKAFG